MNKEALLRKLIADNLVELKSIKECIAQQLLPHDAKQLFEDNISIIMPLGIHCHPEMADCFGKVLYVHQINTEKIITDYRPDRICLMSLNNDQYWYWPLAMVKR